METWLGPNTAVFASVGLFIVWMYRQGRWSLFFQALSGQVSMPLSGSPTSSPNSPTSSPNSGKWNPPKNPKANQQYTWNGKGYTWINGKWVQNLQETG